MSTKKSRNLTLIEVLFTAFFYCLSLHPKRRQPFLIAYIIAAG